MINKYALRIVTTAFLLVASSTNATSQVEVSTATTNTFNSVLPGVPRAMWVWTIPDNQTLVNFAIAHNVQELFYAVSPEIKGEELTRLQALKRLTDAAGITLDALNGDPLWGTTATSGAIAWETQAMKTGLFAGVHFDIEPNQLPDWATNQAGDAALYVAAIRQIKAANPTVHTEVDIQFTWGTIPVSGYKSMADGAIAYADAVTIMSYRNMATGSNSIFEIGEDELKRAQSAGKLVHLAVETNIAQPANSTFYGFTNSQMQAVLTQVDVVATSYVSYRGVAVEDYSGWKELRQ